MFPDSSTRFAPDKGDGIYALEPKRNKRRICNIPPCAAKQRLPCGTTALLTL